MNSQKTLKSVNVRGHNIKLVIFDVDGVLLECSIGKGIHHRILYESFPELKERAVLGDYYNIASTNWPDELKKLFIQLGVSINTEEKDRLKIFSEKLVKYQKENNLIKKFKPVMEFIPKIRKKVLLGILSNNTKTNITTYLDEEILELFTGGIKDYESQVPYLKPSGNGIKQFSEELKISTQEILMIGDGMDDLWAAINAKAKFLFANWLPNKDSARLYYICREVMSSNFVVGIAEYPEDLATIFSLKS